VASVNPDLNIIQNNTQGALYITGGITNSLSSTGTTATVSVAKTGPGLVVLSGANTFSGNLRVYEGTLQFAAGSTVNTGMEFILGSGSHSGKIVLGSGSTGLTFNMDYITTQGVGSENRIVGGASAMSQILLAGSTTTPSTFSNGIIGGSGLYENNIEVRLSALDGSLTLGSNNTYAGATINSRGTIVVEKLANIGEVSSLGTGNFNSTAGTIVMANQTTGTVGSYATAVLKYIGSTDSVTNRPISVTNGDEIRDIVTVTAVLENAGTGTLKFTAPFTSGGSNVADRILRLTGTNAGLNEIVSFADASSTILGKLEKEGLGTWALTGSSTYSGGTTVRQGILLANNNPAVPGSATGLGSVTVQAGATLGGTGRVAPADGQSILVTGGTLNPGLPGISLSAGTLALDTTGAGMLTLQNQAYIVMDLFSGSGAGDNTANALAADLLKISGQVTLGAGTTLRVSNPNGMTSWALNDQWQLFDWSGLTSVQGGFDAYDLPALPECLAWNVDSLLTTGVLSISTLVVVPEPSRLFFFGLGLTSLILRRRR
jgi:autotransporter-associated beta strand protein